MTIDGVECTKWRLDHVVKWVQRSVLVLNKCPEMIIGRGTDGKGALKKIPIFKYTGQKGKLRISAHCAWWIKVDDGRHWRGRGF